MDAAVTVLDDKGIVVSNKHAITRMPRINLMTERYEAYSLLFPIFVNRYECVDV